MFSNSDFGVIIIEDINLPDKNTTVLAGMNYKSISPVTKKTPDVDDWRTLIHFLESAEYSPSAYTLLEKYFYDIGYKSIADEVFIKNKRRERSERLSAMNWAGSFFLDVLVRHGRRPSLALFWSLLFVIVGIFTFRNPQDMELQNEKLPKRTYSSFWYSLDLFVPLVDLYSANVWFPKKECNYLVIYTRVHRILGWILVPIGLIALTGIIK